MAKDMVESGKQNDLLPDWVFDFPISAKTYLDMFGPTSKLGLFRFSDPTYDFSELGKITCPILALYGTEQEAVIGDVTEALKTIEQKARSSRSVITAKISGARHNYRYHEKEVASLISDWVKTTILSPKMN
jgi:alpha/beta superfamily hydrolase